MDKNRTRNLAGASRAGPADSPPPRFRRQDGGYYRRLVDLARRAYEEQSLGKAGDGDNCATFRSVAGMTAPPLRVCARAGGRRLACFLEEHRGKQHNLHLPHFSQRQVLAWADAHLKRTGEWPQASSGPIAGTVRGT